MCVRECVLWGVGVREWVLGSVCMCILVHVHEQLYLHMRTHTYTLYHLFILHTILQVCVPLVNGGGSPLVCAL